MFAEERQNAIVRFVRQRRRLSFSDLQGHFKVSPATLRRDLAGLEEAGEILRVHGGVLDPSYVRSEISLEDRLHRNTAAKKAIAAKAAQLIPAGASVFVDAGSTCLEAGKVLLGRKDLCLISHSVALVGAARNGQAEFLCLGGSLRRAGGALVGGAALGALAALRAEYALVGATGLTPEGCYTTELLEAEIKMAILKQARHAILLADFSKWRNASTVKFAKWPEFQSWIVDKNLPARDARLLKAAGVALHLTR